MFNRKSMKALGLSAVLTLSTVLSACGNGGSSSDNETSLGGKEIDIPYVATDNSTARSLVISEVLQEVGYDVTNTPVESSGPMYASVSQNSDSFHASGIFPTTDKSYFNKFKDNLTVYDKESMIDDVKVGLAVPKYEEDVDSIADLKDDNDFGKSVDWTIQGADSRNGIMKQTKNEIDEEDLEKYKLNESSSQDQLSKIQNAHKQQNPILFTAMEPNWMANELDFKILDDPDKIYGDNNQNINLVFNSNFKEQHPAAYKIATRVASDWSKNDEEELAKEIFVDNKNPEQVAEDYVDDHENKVDEWTEGINNK